MTRTPDTIPQEMLHAFVDGQLPPADMDLVEAYLNANPDVAEEVADWAQQNTDLNALFPAAAQTAAPQVAPPPANTNTAPSGLSWPAIAAALAMMAVGLGGGWFARGLQAPNTTAMASLVQEAVAAHAVYSVDPHRPVEVAGTEEELLVRWLSARVGEQLAAPDLSVQGFTLVGGRLLSVEEGPAAQFMYENEGGKRITLFAVKGSTGQLASFTYNTTGDTGSFYWEDGTLSYAIVGDVGRDDLSTLATAVYDQF